MTIKKDIIMSSYLDNLAEEIHRELAYKDEQTAIQLLTEHISDLEAVRKKIGTKLINKLQPKVNKR